MARVRRFDTGVSIQGPPKPMVITNSVPDISAEVADRFAASAPVKILSPLVQGRGNPRPRRYRQKTYSLLQKDIDLIEALVAEIRLSGLHERGRSDIVRAGLLLLNNLPLKEKLMAVDAVESLK